MGRKHAVRSGKRAYRRGQGLKMRFHWWLLVHFLVLEDWWYWWSLEEKKEELGNPDVFAAMVVLQNINAQCNASSEPLFSCLTCQ
ncbi:hypothetical protein ACH5RR_006550, partial [Cinchona calisaya]